MAKRLHPIDKEILRALMRTRIRVTPSQISYAIGVHPVTAQIRIKELMRRDLVKCKPKGNRTYCKPNIDQIKKMLKKERDEFLFD